MIFLCAKRLHDIIKVPRGCMACFWCREVAHLIFVQRGCVILFGVNRLLIDFCANRLRDLFLCKRLQDIFMYQVFLDFFVCREVG